MRCARHDLACGADGRCALCRKEGTPGSRRPGPKAGTGGTPVLGVLAVLILAAGIIYRVQASRGSIAPVEPKSKVIQLGPIAPPAPADTGGAEESLPPPEAGLEPSGNDASSGH